MESEANRREEKRVIKIHCHPKRQYKTEKCSKHWGYGLCVKETIFLLPYLLICLFLSVLTWSHARYFFSRHSRPQIRNSTDLARSAPFAYKRVNHSAEQNYAGNWWLKSMIGEFLSCTIIVFYWADIFFSLWGNYWWYSYKSYSASLLALYSNVSARSPVINQGSLFTEFRYTGIKLKLTITLT